jgi:hypothetical protein
MGFEPERSRGAGGIEPKLLPPGRFIAVTMELAVMTPPCGGALRSPQSDRPASQRRSIRFDAQRAAFIRTMEKDITSNGAGVDGEYDRSSYRPAPQIASSSICN